MADATNRARRWLPVGIALFLGLGFTWILHARDADEDQNRIRRLVELNADWQSVAMRRVIRLSLGPVESAAAFLASAERVDQQRFAAFTGSLDSYQDVPPQRLMWLPKVTDEERPRFEAGVRANGGPPDFQIMDIGPNLTLQPAAKRPVYFPILHAVVARGGPSYLGTDPFSDPSRQAAMEAARDSGDIGVSVSRPSIPNDGTGPVVSVYAPVFAGRVVPAGITERRDSLVGVVSGIFAVLDLLNAAFDTAPGDAGVIHVAERPFTAIGSVVPLATFDPGKRRFVAADARPIRLDALEGEYAVREIPIGGNRWYVLFHFPKAQVEAMRSNEPWLRLGLGLLLTFALAAYVAAQRYTIDALVQGLGTKDRQLRETSADLAHSNSWLLAAIDFSPVAMVGLDPEGHVMSWNAAAASTFGYSQGEALGRYPPIVPKDRSDSAVELFRRAVAGETLRAIPVIAQTKSGDRLDILLSAAPIRAGDGKVSGVVVMMVDMTGLRQAERRLRQVVKMEALGQLTGGLAHDFNNLLGIIVGNLDMLHDKVEGRADLMRFIDPPLKAALRGSELNNALLAFSQRQDLEPRRLEMGAAVKDMAKMLGRTLGEDIVLEAQTPEDLWPVVADPAQLSSAILHLTVNARDAMPEGGRLMLTAANVWVDDEMRAMDPDLSAARYVCLSVTDTGTGMSPEVVNHAFEPFFTTKRDGKGTGLGLAQVLGFAKQSGGTARIYSELGHGTSVHLYLPCAEDEDEPGLLAIANAPPAPGKGESILVVEDNPPLRDIVVGQLEGLGYKTTAVGSGSEALKAMEGATFDLLFTDIVMPGNMDGRALATAARERRPDLKVLFTSGFAGAAGPDGSALPGRLLRKPYRMQDLAIRVREALDA